MTFIAACVAEGCIVMAGDSRAVSNYNNPQQTFENVEKIFSIRSNIALAIAGRYDLGVRLSDALKSKYSKSKDDLSDLMPKIEMDAKNIFIENYGQGVLCADENTRRQISLEVIICGWTEYAGKSIPAIFHLPSEGAFVRTNGIYKVKTAGGNQAILGSLKAAHHDKLSAVQAQKLLYYSTHKSIEFDPTFTNGKIRIYTLSEKDGLKEINTSGFDACIDVIDKNFKSVCNSL